MLRIWTGKMTQSANCLSYKYEGLHWIPEPTFSKAKCVGMACNASTREAESGECPGLNGQLLSPLWQAPRQWDTLSQKTRLTVSGLHMNTHTCAHTFAHIIVHTHVQRPTQRYAQTYTNTHKNKNTKGTNVTSIICNSYSCHVSMLSWPFSLSVPSPPFLCPPLPHTLVSSFVNCIPTAIPLEVMK